MVSEHVARKGCGGEPGLESGEIRIKNSCIQIHVSRKGNGEEQQRTELLEKGVSNFY